MPFTAEELEAMRLADEEIEREFEESYSAQYADAEISKWLDEQAINDTLDHKQLHKKRQQRAYREEHKDEIAAQQRAYREEHKDEIAAQQRAYYEEHKDEIAAQQRAYREEHKDEIAAKKRAYYEEHKDEIAAQQRAYRKRKRQQEYMIAAEIKNTAPDTAMSESGT